MKSYLAPLQQDVGAISRSRRLQATVASPSRASPFVLRKPIYPGNDFSTYHQSRRIPRGVHALNALRNVERLGPPARQGAMLAASQNKTLVAASLFGLGPAELLVIGGVALFIFGPQGLKGAGSQLGKAARELKGAAAEFSEELKSEMDEKKEELPEPIESQNATTKSTSTSS
eukprot:gnl/TRDRNA2_/TRDRNA2_125845_c0_seq1.p1 gnl/TRDRNA2_/TRDRNA2_125845_c0~~gnl/TRDRNA2_/TRDRNA2_125845_c0_seq1.p1  ORF type:complete len:198 (-),score=31.69 gnl/TRDRNA2_/TRDRNA2_125845_c0_seq1:194-712(-)